MLLLKHFSNGYFIHRGAELAEELDPPRGKLVVADTRVRNREVAAVCAPPLKEDKHLISKLCRSMFPSGEE